MDRPVLSLTGAYAGLFNPPVLLSTYIPETITRGSVSVPSSDFVIDPAHRVIYNQLGAYSLLTFSMSALLYRCTRDLKVWRVWQGSVLVVDVVILGAAALAYRQQGRLSLLKWRSEDWFAVVVTGICALLRAGFCLGIGVREGEKGTEGEKRKRK
ncbi:hypothetical protein HRR86_006440 [Exophiala dermatitidis]|uniref:DUF7704 domain-containing protein n=1 Tax=Exophiala dermatitidis (strain ATCC 34100 / CBS 525.76 / NIH/UT8656) TaxID=858893 RepID=H6C266_EXODN|nr:uncharacterized protein HMPREF1120_06702 [Exophiala dermatitidis NIH/UT8656]EHY58698.1 hypothetical protein HMPREF1120_06702 [Exophiala dermatitidis NIH/UT8656]KAJ4575813.1 hypothetical protein HRR82_006106 [Exophiala dermatitidis]KAJ4616173.1 hypothetical protein HRR85_003037 [Exophiala dermatitidis]KAJ4620560.1 hypothetical protein HRR86_006440 [Exophiala dermatitidis]